MGNVQTRAKRIGRIGVALLVLMTWVGVIGHVSPAAAASCTWTRLPDASFPPPPQADGIAGISAQEAWAIDWGTRAPTVAGFDGTRWTTTQIADPGFDGGYFNGVAAAQSGDVWAVGTHSRSATPYDNPSLAAHWDGSSWTTFSPPGPSKGNGFLEAVSAPAADDVWAVGYEGGIDASPDDSTLVEHWNGASWSQVPGPATSFGLRGVVAFSDHDVWAITINQIYHWNGTSWRSRLPSPSSFFLSAISGDSRSDIWAVGSDVYARTLTMHWDGTLWTHVPSPNRGSGANSLAAVAVRSAKSAWAVGAHGKGSQPLVLHWDGTSWQVKRTPADASLYQRLTSVSAVPGTRTIWTIGIGDLVERFC